MQRKLEIDFSSIETLEQMHNLLKKEFGFPDFYGKNVNALIDCWSELRAVGGPGETMCDFTLQKDEPLILQTKNLSSKKEIIINHFLVAVEAVNRWEISHKAPPSLLLCPW